MGGGLVYRFALLSWIMSITLFFFFLLIFRWAGQGAEENLHKMGQQASHQGMCLRLAVVICPLFGSVQMLVRVNGLVSIANAVLNSIENYKTFAESFDIYIWYAVIQYVMNALKTENL